jgi:hypothetical protein
MTLFEYISVAFSIVLSLGAASLFCTRSTLLDSCHVGRVASLPARSRLVVALVV